MPRLYRVDRLRLRHLRLLEAIHRAGSLSRAANELGIAQPAATVMLRDLEAAFGVGLVERDARGGKLNSAGLQALERLAIALASVDLALTAVHRPAPNPTLRVGIMSVIGIAVFPALIAHLQAQSYAYHIQLHEGSAHDLLSSLYKGQVDCVIGRVDDTQTTGIPHGELDIMPLRHETLQVVASARHRLAQLESVLPTDIARQDWVVPALGTYTRAAFERMFLNEGINPPMPKIESLSLHTNLFTIAASDMLTLVPSSAFQTYSKLGTLVELKGEKMRRQGELVSFIAHRERPALLFQEKVRAALQFIG